MQEPSYYHISSEETLKTLNASASGLSSTEVQQRLLQYGPNELVEKKDKPWWVYLLKQFTDFMIVVLLIAAIISGFLGDKADTLIIIVLVIINALIGFSQEYRAREAIKALKKMAALHAIVLRDQEIKMIDAAGLVPGDIIILEAGNIVPADARLTEASSLLTRESALTGEAAEAEKSSHVLKSKDIPLGDRKNMVFKGTVVTRGYGKAIVTATGMKTELGKIASMLHAEEAITPLQKRLQHFSRQLSVVILFLCAVIFVIGWLREGEPMIMLLTAISLAVAAIPEALPSVITIALSLGARRMARKNALIKKLPAVETLGSVTYICTDKTGTLTQDKMEVQKIYFKENMYNVAESPLPNHSLPGQVFYVSALNNTVADKSNGEMMGDATEVALYQFAKNNQYSKKELLKQFPLLHVLPFDSSRKCMTTIHANNGSYISFTKGAADVLIKKAHFNSEEEEINVFKAAEQMAAEGLRVIALAVRQWRELPATIDEAAIETGINIIALAGIADPVRKESLEAVHLCKTAGIIPVMITGDHPATARMIAKKVAIIDSENDLLVSSAQMEKMHAEEFRKKVEHIKVYARVTPEQKLQIVKVLQEKGHFVAMTGDGVNDAPALQAANIGIAMGITGTDVSKEAADMILLDDNFSTIVKAVKEGRHIYDNIRKFIGYVLTGNTGEVLTIFLAPFFGLPVPLLPVHILWINLVTDGLPGLAFTAERTEKNIMQRPPRPPAENIFSHGLGVHILLMGFLTAVICILTQTISLYYDDNNWQTMVFTVLCFSQLGNAMAVRSETASIFKTGFLSNMPMLLAVTGTVILQMALIYVPFFNSFFKTNPLSFEELIITFALSTLVFWAIELEKMFIRLKLKKKQHK